MPDPQTFPAVLIAICFFAVFAAVIVAVMVESGGFRQLRRMRRRGYNARPVVPRAHGGVSHGRLSVGSSVPTGTVARG
jgi:hypothetical protein